MINDDAGLTLPPLGASFDQSHLMDLIDGRLNNTWEDFGPPVRVEIRQLVEAGIEPGPL